MMPLDAGQMPMMVPTAQLLSMMEEPSSGSQQTQNLPSACVSTTSGSSSDAAWFTRGSVLHASHMSSSAITSTPSCTSPNWLSEPATVTSAVRSASVILPHTSSIAVVSFLSSGSDIFAESTSSSDGYESFATASV